jgi:hypothetical protein
LKGVTTLSIAALSIITFSIKLSKLQQSAKWHNFVLPTFMMSVTKAFMLSVIMLNAVILSVVALIKQRIFILKTCHECSISKHGCFFGKVNMVV